LVYQGISGGLMLRNYFRSSRELTSDTGAWRKTDASGAQYEGYGSSANLENGEHSSNAGLRSRGPGDFNPKPSPEDLAAIEKAKEDHKWDPPRYEFALQGGYMHMRESYLTGVGVIETSSDPNRDAYLLYLQDEVGDGWAAGGSVTVNSCKYFSNEFSYFHQQVKYQLGSLNLTLPANRPFVDDDVLHRYRQELLLRTPVGSKLVLYANIFRVHVEPQESKKQFLARNSIEAAALAQATEGATFSLTS